MIAGLSSITAPISGVTPNIIEALTFAPLSTNTRAISVRPLEMAAISGVIPRIAFPFGSAPLLSASLTNSVSPFTIALISARVSICAPSAINIREISERFFSNASARAVDPIGPFTFGSAPFDKSN